MSSFVCSQLVLCTSQPLFLSHDLRCCLGVREVTVSPFAHLKRRNSRGLAVTPGSEEHSLEVGGRSVLGQQSALFHEQWNWWSPAFCCIPFPFCLCPQSCRHPTRLRFFAALACGSLRALKASTTERNSPVWCRLLSSSPRGTINYAAVWWSLPGKWSRLKLAPLFVSFIPEKPPQPRFTCGHKDARAGLREKAGSAARSSDGISSLDGLCLTRKRQYRWHSVSLPPSLGTYYVFCL